MPNTFSPISIKDLLDLSFLNKTKQSFQPMAPNIDWYPQPISPIPTSSPNPVVVNPFEEAKNRLIAGKARGKRLFGKADVGYTGVQTSIPITPISYTQPLPITPISYTQPLPSPVSGIPSGSSSSYSPATYQPATYKPTTYQPATYQNSTSQSYSWSRPPVSYAGSYALPVPIIVSRGF